MLNNLNKTFLIRPVCFEIKYAHTLFKRLIYEKNVYYLYSLWFGTFSIYYYHADPIFLFWEYLNLCLFHLLPRLCLNCPLCYFLYFWYLRTDNSFCLFNLSYSWKESILALIFVSDFSTGFWKPSSVSY